MAPNVRNRYDPETAKPDNHPHIREKPWAAGIEQARPAYDYHRDRINPDPMDLPGHPSCVLRLATISFFIDYSR